MDQVGYQGNKHAIRSGPDEKVGKIKGNMRFSNIFPIFSIVKMCFLKKKRKKVFKIPWPPDAR